MVIEHQLSISKMVKIRGDKNRKIKIVIPEFHVNPKEVVAVVGPNGCGKSTLLDMLGLILSPDKTEVFSIKGESPIDPCNLALLKKNRIRRSHFSYILQTGGLLEFLTIKENILFAASLKDKPKDKVEKIINKLGIEDILNKRPGKVSGGQRQKAAIARALVQKANIILADEPTSAMDLPSASKLMTTFQELIQETEVSLIMVTHDYKLAKCCASRFYCFKVKEIADNYVYSFLSELGTY